MFLKKLGKPYEGSNEPSLFHRVTKNSAQLSLPETVELQEMSKSNVIFIVELHMNYPVKSSQNECSILFNNTRHYQFSVDMAGFVERRCPFTFKLKKYQELGIPLL